MKAFTFILPLILLQNGVFASSDPDLTELMKQLTDLIKKENASAYSEIGQQYTDTLIKLNTLVSENVVTSIKNENEKVENYINDLENQMMSSGYDGKNCTEYVKKLYEFNKLPNITALATMDFVDVYNKILYNDYSVGTHNIDVISKELDSISAEYAKCLLSGQPQYCNQTMPDRLSAKLEEFPVLYSKEVQRTKLTFIQEVANFENRIQDYVQLAIAIIKPYMYLLESCVAQILVVGNFEL